MADDMMSLSAVPEKSADADLLCEMICHAAHRLMEIDVESLTDAAQGKSGTRV